MKSIDARVLRRRIMRAKRMWYYEKLKKEEENERNKLYQGTVKQA